MSDLPDEGRPPAPAPPLSSADRRTLRARAHALDPVVRVGDAGLTEAVVAETDRALGAHGLIKVRIFGDDRDARQAMAAELEARTGSALVQAIGKLVVLWRPRAQDTGPIGAAQPAPAKKRATLSVPKKLAAEGKPAPRRRARPGAPTRARAAEPAARRPRAPAGRPVGPGLRDARGALDPSVARPAPGGAASGAPGARRPAAGGRAGGGPAGRAAGPGSRAGGARPAGRGAGSTAARGPVSGASRGAGSAARPAGGPPARGGFGSAPARGSAPVRGGAGASRSGGGAPRGPGGTGARGPSPARSGAGAPRGTGRAGTPATGSGRPGPRTRAGRRGP